MIDFSGIEMPFNVTDLLQSTTGLISMVGPFLLLGLALLFAYSLSYFIKMAIYNYQDNKFNKDKPRDQQSYWDAVKTDLVENKLYRIQKKFR